MSEEEIAARKEETQRRKIELRLQKASLAVLALYTLFTGWLLYETRISTIAVTKSTENTAQFFRTDERAWIELEPIKPILFAPKSREVPRTVYTYELYPRNFGKTPARDVAMKAITTGAGETFGNDETSITNMQDKFLQSRFVDSETGKPIPVTGSPIPLVLAPNTAAPIPFLLHGQDPQIFRDGHGFYDYLLGRIDYVDEFNVSHWMKFCFLVVNPRGELRYCRFGNEEDRNAEKPMSPGPIRPPTK